MTTTSLRVAAAQISSRTDKDENLRLALQAIGDGAAAGAQVVVLPEATSMSFATHPAKGAEPLDGPFATALREAASNAGVTVVAGLFEPAPDGRVSNVLLVTGPDGETTYRKVHLFDAFGSRESDTVAPGTDYVTTTIAGVTVGLATCFDLRFADQFTALGQRGAEVILVPASWGGGPGKAEQWDLLTRARAMDAQAWLVASGQAWQEPQGAAPLGLGRSVAAGPDGTVLQQLDGEPGLLVVDLDLVAVRDFRRRVPILG